MDRYARAHSRLTGSRQPSVDKTVANPDMLDRFDQQNLSSPCLQINVHHEINTKFTPRDLTLGSTNLDHRNNSHHPNITTKLRLTRREMLIKEDLTLGSTNLDRRERQARSDRARRSTGPWWAAVQRRRPTLPPLPPNSRGPCSGIVASARTFCRVQASLSVRKACTSRPDAVPPHPVAEAAPEPACRR